MGRRSRVVVLGVGYVVAIAIALFAMNWFVVDSVVRVIAFYGSCLHTAIVFGIVYRFRTTGVSDGLRTFGVIHGLVLIVAGVIVGGGSFAPIVYVIGHGLGIAAMHAAAKRATEDSAGEYHRVVVDVVSKAPSVSMVPLPRPKTIPPAFERAVRPATTPPSNKPKLSYVVASAEITRAGIDARREDGSSLLVLWRDVVGVVVRRLPDELAATTFLDLVSIKGSTLRILPTSRLTGISVSGQGDTRVRGLVGYITATCADVAIDPATKSFIDGEPAGQLKTLDKLAAHDERLG